MVVDQCKSFSAIGDLDAEAEAWMIEYTIERNYSQEDI